MKLKLLLVLLLLPACSIKSTNSNYQKHQGPNAVQCAKSSAGTLKAIKVCRQAGSFMFCECHYVR